MFVQGTDALQITTHLESDGVLVGVLCVSVSRGAVVHLCQDPTLRRNVCETSCWNGRLNPSSTGSSSTDMVDTEQRSRKAAVVVVFVICCRGRYERRRVARLTDQDRQECVRGL